MSLPVAYCRQVNEVIDIVRAHDYYFSQDEPRTGLEFLCPDAECRNEKNQPIIGINYNKLPTIDNIVQKQHFRLINPDNHRQDCPWIEVKAAIDELDSESGSRRFSNLKRSQLINVFNPLDADQERNNPRIDAAQMPVISALATRRTRITAYKAYLRDNPNRTSRLQEVAGCFESLTADERPQTLLNIEGLGEKTYRQHFTAAQYCIPSAHGKKIYYGFASVYQWSEGYNIRFRQSAKQDDDLLATVNVFVSHDMLDRFRGKGVILATFLAAKEIGGNVLSCYAFGSVERTDSKGKSRLDIKIQSLHSLSVMLKEQG